jgi:hypothetical protein
LGGIAFDVPADWLGRDWWDLLAPAVSRSVDADYPIDDSKKLFGKPKGRAGAERTVAGVLGGLPQCAATEFPCIESLVQALAVGCLEELRREHWFAERTALSLKSHDGLRESLKRSEVRIAAAAFDLVFPNRFNELLGGLENKALVQRDALQPLLQRLLDDDDSPESVYVVVDRLGGRKFYRTLVEDVAGDAFVMTRNEDARLSRYEFTANGRTVEVTFAVEADGFSLPTALASIVAKYLRECAMEGFNAFWKKRIPSLKPTAGYPLDAGRFRGDVEGRLAEFGVSMSEFWRMR